MKQKIKNYLIHLLGGKTAAEASAKGAQGYKAGYNFAYAEVHEYMKEQNGLNAHDWCDRMWQYVAERRQAQQ